MVVKIAAPVPNQFYDVLYCLYTGKLLSDWFGAERLAETFCTADYFILDDLKKAAIARALAVDKLRIVGSWFSKGDDLSPQLQVHDMVSASCQIDRSLTPQAMGKLRKELGPLVFNGVIPSSYFGDVLDRTLAQMKQDHEETLAEARTGYDKSLARVKQGHDEILARLKDGYKKLKNKFKSPKGKLWECSCSSWNIINTNFRGCSYCYNYSASVTFNSGPGKEIIDISPALTRILG
ncbi:hypothetical protein HK102_008429 [Quaeritorhiza haematococci]|nr:hypothetical protein HK102_008429 [Quaeritorhiza haematococci]